jgi:IS66 C-terminal element
MTAGWRYRTTPPKTPFGPWPKNYLFAGSHAGGECAAAFYTLIQTAKLNGLEPQTYLRDVLACIVTNPIRRIVDLLPAQCWL